MTYDEYVGLQFLIPRAWGQKAYNAALGVEIGASNGNVDQSIFESVTDTQEQAELLEFKTNSGALEKEARILIPRVSSPLPEADLPVRVPSALKGAYTPPQIQERGEMPALPQPTDMAKKASPLLGPQSPKVELSRPQQPLDGLSINLENRPARLNPLPSAPDVEPKQARLNPLPTIPDVQRQVPPLSGGDDGAYKIVREIGKLLKATQMAASGSMNIRNKPPGTPMRMHEGQPDSGSFGDYLPHMHRRS